METDAALAFQAAEKAQMGDNLVEMKTQLLKAKQSIDVAAANAETRQSPKTLYLKGRIYNLLFFTEMLGDVTFNKSVPENVRETAIKAFKEVYEIADKYDRDIEDNIAVIKNLLYTKGSAEYDEKKYKEATFSFVTVNEYTAILNRVDTTAYYFAALAAEQDNNFIQAAVYYKKCADLQYKTNLTYRAAANAYIKSGQFEQAIQFLKQAIMLSPEDKNLYFALGTAAMEVQDDKTVVESLNKAAQIDPNYADAYYNLGSYYMGKAATLTDQAAKLPPNQKSEADKLSTQSLIFYDVAVLPLEKYLTLMPKDLEVIKVLIKIAKAQKNTEKETRYRQLLAAANNE